MKFVSGAVAVLIVAGALESAQAADIEAGREKAEACAACHGMNGISVSGDIPNLAGQNVEYLAGQLKAFRDGKRQNPIMNPIAGGLEDADIDDLAAFWNSLPGATGGAPSQMLAAVNKTRVGFPGSERESFTWYTTINFPDRKQVRKYFANDVAVGAARAGKPMPHGALFFVEAYSAKLDGAGKPVVGSDGFFEPDRLLFFTAMQTNAGWGDDIPDLYRNGDWNYAVFSPDGKVNPTINQAKCFACHKPLADKSYVFSLDALIAKVKN